MGVEPSAQIFGKTINLGSHRPDQTSGKASWLLGAWFLYCICSQEISNIMLNIQTSSARSRPPRPFICYQVSLLLPLILEWRSPISDGLRQTLPGQSEPMHTPRLSWTWSSDYSALEALTASHCRSWWHLAPSPLPLPPTLACVPWWWPEPPLGRLLDESQVHSTESFKKWCLGASMRLLFIFFPLKALPHPSVYFT